jgi:hypothetical protein
VHNLFHSSRPRAADGFPLREQGVGWTEMQSPGPGTARCRPKSWRGSDQSEGGDAQRGRGSQSVLSRDSWVVGVRPRSAGWAASAAAICARAATIWVRSPAAMIGVGSVSFWGSRSRTHLLAPKNGHQMRKVTCRSPLRARVHPCRSRYPYSKTQTPRKLTVSSQDLQETLAQMVCRGDGPIMERTIRSATGRQWKIIGAG